MKVEASADITTSVAMVNAYETKEAEMPDEGCPTQEL